MKHTQLRSKDVIPELAGYPLTLSKKDQVERVEGEHTFLFINKQPAFWYYEQKLVPTLRYLQQHDLLKKIVVDMGAVKFVINGADIMRPGITLIDESIQQEEFIVIVDENNKKPLAVGIALFNGTEMRQMATGKVVKNIHYVGDEIWKEEV